MSLTTGGPGKSASAFAVFETMTLLTPARMSGPGVGASGLAKNPVIVTFTTVAAASVPYVISSVCPCELTAGCEVIPNPLGVAAKLEKTSVAGSTSFRSTVVIPAPGATVSTRFAVTGNDGPVGVSFSPTDVPQVLVRV